jgi:hypothetical protein
MTTTSECPICFDIINSTNQTITECGHAFHTNCLMKNVMHNGFGCPYCRAKMCEEPETSLSDEEEDSDYSGTDDADEEDGSELETGDEEDIQDWLAHERIHRTEERAFANLRRLFTENEEELQEEPAQVPQYQQNEEEGSLDSTDSESDSDDEHSLAGERIDSGRERPTTDYITQKLMQRGINMGHLVKLMIVEYPLYDDIMTRRHYRRDTRNLHDQLRDIINNYDAREEEEYDTPDDDDEEEEHGQQIIALDLD